MDIIGRKLKTFSTLVKEGRVREVLQTTTGYLVRLMRYRLDELDIDSYTLGRFKAKIPLECRIASSTDMQLLFEHWPDSQEEYERHYEVYYRWGFKTCFLFFHRDTGEVAHFQFLLRYEDRSKIQQFLPTKRYKFLSSSACAYQEWLYTFEKYRRLGISLQATDYLIKFCRDNGIKKLFSHRGMSNVPSVRMADKIGFVPIASIYHIQFLHQKKHSGLYVLKLSPKTSRYAFSGVL